MTMAFDDGTRDRSRQGRLARLGFNDAARSVTLLEDVALVGLALGDDVFAGCADPDRAALGMVRLAESARSTPATGRLLDEVVADPTALNRLLALLGASQALADHLVRHPGHLEALQVSADNAASLPRTLLDSIPQESAIEGAMDSLRVSYRRELVWLAARDLASPEPSQMVDEVAARLADLAGAALEAALTVARTHTSDAECCRIAILGMGKCGAHELNYVSDVDVIYIVEPQPGVEEAHALAVGTQLAATTARICSANTPEGTLWAVDANLRPEGKDGPLVRTVASHQAYYERWAKTWEFQALLKARHVAGDQELSAKYLDVIGPLVWEASGRENFVLDTQAMRRRVEQNVPLRDVDRQIKLGRGGLRDIEFSVQLLQLVHGRADDSLRAAATLPSLAALAAGGYVGRPEAATMEAAYRFLRTLEHHNQLDRLKRTHVLPNSPSDLRRLARSLRLQDDEELMRKWRETRVLVRQLHEALYYRPLLAAAAELSTDEARLTPAAARARLAALGYRDPAGAMQHIEALTAGLSRRAAIQHQILPVLLGWFAQGIDPDMGLLAFRTLSDSLGTTHWYLKMLRDTAAAQSLTSVLSSSKYAIDLLQHSTEATRWFGDEAALRPRDAHVLRSEVDAVVRRRRASADVAFLARHFRGRELLRASIGDVLGVVSLDEVGHGITAATTAAMQGSLLAAQSMVATRRGLGSSADDLPLAIAVIGMGSLGGDFMGYTSDADVMFVFRAQDGVGDPEATEVATEVVTTLQKLLQEPLMAAPSVDVSTDLRPEGRAGPVVRSLDSYAEYYRRWGEIWEAQALLRAVPVAGDADLGRDFIALIDPIRYPKGGLEPAQVKEIRRIKARVESERLPRGVSPQRHLKLGPGGMTDVEWVVQLKQMQHAAELESLRTTNTLAAIAALKAADILNDDDASALESAYRHSARLRNCLTLWKARSGDVMPSDRRDLEAAARLIGFGPHHSTMLEDEHLRVTRRARAVVERLFYG